MHSDTVLQALIHAQKGNDAKARPALDRLLAQAIARRLKEKHMGGRR